MKTQQTYIFLSFENPFTVPTEDKNESEQIFHHYFVKLYDCKGVYNGVAESSACYVLRNAGTYNQALEDLQYILRDYGQHSALIVQGNHSQLLFAHGKHCNAGPSLPLGRYVEVFPTEDHDRPLLFAYTEYNGRFFACNGVA